MVASNALGFLLAICGNTAIAWSLTLQKLAHNTSASECALEDRRADEFDSTPDPISPGDSDASSFRFLRNPTWWAGTALMAAGEIGNFAAFAFAPASLVAPLGAWSVVLSAVLAHAFLRERMSPHNLAGIVLCVSGALIIGASAPSGAESSLDAVAVMHLLVRTPFVIFILATLTATAALIYLSHRTTLGHHYVFIYVGVSSLLGGVTVVCAKALSTFLMLTFEGNSQFGNWLPFALAVTLATAIVAQLRYLNLAMARFGNSQVIPVYYVMFTICAISSGAIMFREFDTLTLSNMPFFLGLICTMSGIFLISRSTETESQKDFTAQKLANPSAGGIFGKEQYQPLPPVMAPPRVDTRRDSCADWP